MRSQVLLILWILLILLEGCASADFWSASVGTNTSSWGIYRESGNISFSYEQHVSGKVDMVDGPNNRSLSPYYSCFSDVKINDVSIRERVAALKGTYKSDELMAMQSRSDTVIDRTAEKPAGSDEYTISYHETWPVIMIQRKSMAYSGNGINARETAGNNLDYAKANFLYSDDFVKDTTIRLSLSRLNATVVATDNGIERAERRATRYTDFRVRAHATGISDMSYLQSGSMFTGKPISGYEIINAGEERYYGVYNMTRIIKMQTIENKPVSEDSWLPCCSGGWDDMSPSDRAGYGISASKIFDCSCAKP